MASARAMLRQGTARLRLSLTLNVDEACIEAMAGVLAEELEPA